MAGAVIASYPWRRAPEPTSASSHSRACKDYREDNSPALLSGIVLSRTVPRNLGFPVVAGPIHAPTRPFLDWSSHTNVAVGVIVL